MTSQLKASFFLLLLLLFWAPSTEAKLTPMVKQEGQVKFWESLGLSCRCCDGVGGECSATWKSTCAKLDCHPWKFL